MWSLGHRIAETHNSFGSPLWKISFCQYSQLWMHHTQPSSHQEVSGIPQKLVWPMAFQTGSSLGIFPVAYFWLLLFSVGSFPAIPIVRFLCMQVISSACLVLLLIHEWQAELLGQFCLAGLLVLHGWPVGQLPHFFLSACGSRMAPYW